MVAPANDAFADAVAVELDEFGEFSLTVTATDATTEVDEPVYNAAYPTHPITRTVWFTYTPAETSTLQVTTTGTTGTGGTPDTVVTVYQGTAVDGLTLVEQEDDADYLSDWTFSLTAAEDYVIQVGSWSGPTTISYQINFTGPPTPFVGGGDLTFSGYAYNGIGELERTYSFTPLTNRSPVRTVHVALPTPTLVDGRPT